MMSEPSTDASDFFAALLQDHALIEERLKELEQAAHAVGQVESDTAALGIVAETLRFFANEGARHQASEELTLFPRLRSLSDFKPILSAIEFQHQMNEAAERELTACVERFAPGGGRELRRLALRFVELNRAHAFAEERAMFPLAASVLPPPVLAEMSREMRERQRAPSRTGERR